MNTKKGKLATASSPLGANSVAPLRRHDTALDQLKGYFAVTVVGLNIAVDFLAPVQDALSQRIFDEPADSPAQGPSTHTRILALFDQMVAQLIRDGQFQAAFTQLITDITQLQINDLIDLLARQRPEDNNVVYPIEELRAEGLA